MIVGLEIAGFIVGVYVFVGCEIRQQGVWNQKQDIEISQSMKKQVLRISQLYLQESL